MAYTNNNGQARVGVRSGQTPSASTLWNSIYAVYNGDSVGSSSLKTSLYAAYNGESNANDSFGSNNGTAVGSVTYATGKIGTAFQFAATNTYVNIPNTTDHLNFTGDFSISLWVNYNTTAASNEIFITNMKAGGTFGSGWFFQTDPSNLRFTINATSTQNSFGVPFTPSVNTWYHFVVTRKRSTETKIYINGVLQSGTYSLNNPTVDPTYQAGQEYNIGAYILPQRYFSNIRIDALNIWTKELSASEITELYNSGNGAQYITNDFYKPTTNDALGTNNGTAVGGLTYGLGKVGTAFQFNGTNSSVNLGDNLDIRTSSWSYNVWFNCSSYTNAPYIFSKGRSTWENFRFGLSLTTDGKLRPVVIAANPTMLTPTSTQTISTNQWYMATMVIDRSLVSGQYQFVVRLYINGVLETLIGVNSFPSNFTLTDFDNIANFRIGSFNDSSNNGNVANFNGSIDAFNVWNRVLTQSEITELYNSGNGKQYPN